IIVGKDQMYMYYSTFHWQTLLNGYSGFFPPSYLRLVAAMRGFPDVGSMAALRSRGARYAVIHGEMLSVEEYQRVIGAIDDRGWRFHGSPRRLSKHRKHPEENQRRTEGNDGRCREVHHGRPAGSLSWGCHHAGKTLSHRRVCRRARGIDRSRKRHHSTTRQR